MLKLQKNSFTSYPANLDYISKWENINKVLILSKHIDNQIKMICQFRFHERYDGKTLFILHATNDHENKNLHQLEIFRQSWIYGQSWISPIVRPP
jgi:hypothetical protein